MSSDEEDVHDLGDSRANGNEDGTKRRKILRACDRCRRKKVRCDLREASNGPCRQCATAGLDCAFVENAKKRSPPRGYLEAVENRCEALEGLLAKVAPHVNVANEIGPSFTRETWKTSMGDSPRPRSSLTNGTEMPAPPQIDPQAPTPGNAILTNDSGPPLVHQEPTSVEISDNSDDEYPDSNMNYIIKFIEVQMEQLNMNGFMKRYHGKSSGAYLMQAAIDLKEKADGIPAYGQQLLCSLRLPYWTPNAWEWLTPSTNHPSKLTYPPDDLADFLVDLAFDNVLPFYPMIHRPTFDMQRKNKLHLRSESFARVYLMVCAVGARYSRDDRVYLSCNNKSEKQWSSGGWIYCSQVLNMRWPVLAPSSQADLQVMGLVSIYLQHTSTSQASWLLAGLGLRASIDIGLHRQRIYAKLNAFEAQMWRRIFWSLVSLDRITSACFGRPMSLHEEEIDVELPLAVDDDFYDVQKGQWKQPEGKPSGMSAFIHLSRLMGILARAIRYLYSPVKAKLFHGYVGEDWESRTVAELDSDLNSWLENVPDTFKWRPNIECNAAFQKAALLKLSYHWVQIVIHRPFLPAIWLDGKASALSFPSLAICTNAGRAASHVLEQYSERGFSGPPLSHNIAFIIGIVLLISVYAVKKSRLSVDTTKQADDVRRFADFLRKGENIWHSAGKFYDILQEIATLHRVSFGPSPPEVSGIVGKKRDREAEISSSGAGPNNSPLSVESTQPSSTYTTPSLFSVSDQRMATGTILPPPSGPPGQLAAFSIPASAFSAGPLVPPPVDDQDRIVHGVDHYAVDTLVGNGASYLPTGTASSMGVPPSGTAISPTTLFEDFMGVFGDASLPQTGDLEMSNFMNTQDMDEWGWINDILGNGQAGQPNSMPPPAMP